MKTQFLTLALSIFSFHLYAQDFAKNMSEAKSTYSSGNLSDARFAMEQMLHDIDMEIGKQILGLLPTEVNSLPANTKDDNVNGMTAGFGSGLYVTRTYGTDDRFASIDIVNNSPLISSLNALLTLPFVGRSSDSNQKVIKIQGYKSILNKSEGESGIIDYELQIPFNNTLMTLKVEDTNEADILKIADSIPLSKIVEMAQ